ncbi:MAG: DUF4097 family beta strand repeat-containing protein [Porcipelethomonas sp.]
MKKKFFTAAAAVLLAAVPLCGCGVNMNYETYDNDDKYSTLAPAPYTSAMGEFNGVESLDVSWLSGSVEILPTKDSTVSVTETCEIELENDEALHYWLDNGTLRIRYAESGLNVSFDDEKKLTIYIPESISLEECEIDVTSAEVNLDNLRVKDISISTTSGAVTGDLIGTETLESEATSGTVKLSGDALRKVDVSTTSGTFELSSQNTPAEIDAESTSGNLTFNIPADSEFTAELESTSGDFNTDFSAEKSGGRYIVGGGENEYSFDTTSADVSVMKN